MFILSWIQIVGLVFFSLVIFAGLNQHFEEETWKSYVGTSVAILLILLIAQS